MGRESFFFFPHSACASACLHLLICFPKPPFSAAQVICSGKAESPLATSPRPPLTLAASSKGAWGCCAACNVCSQPGPAAAACLPRGVSSASCSAPGETGRPLLLAQGQSPRALIPQPTASSLASLTSELSACPGVRWMFPALPCGKHPASPGVPAWEHLGSPAGATVRHRGSCAQGWAEMEVMQHQPVADVTWVQFSSSCSFSSQPKALPWMRLKVV